MTLTGPGGCGKTRLALELATELQPEYAGDVAFVELASVRDPALVRESVARALGLLGEASDRMAAVVGDASLLLVVDNAEHVLDAVSTLVQELLTGCPNLTVLTTSRELLDVAGEVSWRVPPLRLPPAPGLGVATDVVEVAGCDAVQLFCARAAQHQPGFHLTPDNAALVAAICRRLDGIPLALELAAARVRSLALTDILGRLDDSFQLLVSGSRSAVPRHRTLQATFDWSYSLLDEQERRLFRRLSVFMGTCDLAAVEAVCACPALPAAEVAHLLHRLVDKSLVAARGQPDGGMRYTLIEVVRQYAQQWLAREQPAERPDLEARHARHYADLIAHLRPLHSDYISVESAPRLGVEYDNIRLALEWAAREDLTLLAMTAVRLIRFWFLRGSLQEARHHVGAAVRADAPTGVRAKLLMALAGYSRQVGDLTTAVEQIEEASGLLDPGQRRGRLRDPAPARGDPGRAGRPGRRRPGLSAGARTG